MKNFLFLLSVLLVTVSFGQTAEEYYNQGYAKFESKDYSGAIADYTKAIELNPKYTFVYYNRGLAKNLLKDFRGAKVDFTKAIEIDPADAKLYGNRGIAKANLKDYQGAIVDYTKAIELDSAYALAYHNRGIAKYRLPVPDLDGACLDLSKAGELGLDNAYKIIKEICN